MRTKFIWMALIGSLGICLMLSGCESNEGHLGDGHDFGTNNPVLYVAFGDSITYGSGVPNQDAYPVVLSAMLGKTVITDAIPGSSTGEGLDRIESTLRRYSPGYMLILYGVNDVIMGYGADEAVDSLRLMAQDCISNKTIPVLATYPATYGDHAAYDDGVEELNVLIRNLGEDMGLAVVDLNSAFANNGGEALMLMPDGLHPNIAGHQVMAQTFFDKVN